MFGILHRETLFFRTARYPAENQVEIIENSTSTFKRLRCLKVLVLFFFF